MSQYGWTDNLEDTSLFKILQGAKSSQKINKIQKLKKLK
jgi:hypothetical protein